MAAEVRATIARAGVALARRLPVGLLRWVNRSLHRSVAGRRALVMIRHGIAAEPATIARGPLAGLKFVAGGGQPAYLLGAAEPDLQDALSRCVGEGDVVYDVGANVGFFTLLAARLAGASGRVCAFEPVPDSAAALRHNAELNGLSQVEVVEQAVADTCDPVAMSIGANLATARLGDRGERVVLVQCTTLDAFAERPGRAPDVVKIDVEGAENLVLAGMAGLLSAHRPLVLCELHYSAGDPRRRQISETLADAGYAEWSLSLDGGSMPHLLALPRERPVPAGLSAVPAIPMAARG